MRRLVAVVIAGMIVVAVAAAGAAEAKLPLGEADGVRIHRQDGALVVTFTRRAARLYRRVAGRWISVFCTELPREDERGTTTESGGGSPCRPPSAAGRSEPEIAPAGWTTAVFGSSRAEPKAAGAGGTGAS